MPLYCCRACGFATTAAWRNAVNAHDVGVPLCEGELEMRANFAAQPQVFPWRTHRVQGIRRGAELPDSVTDPARSRA